MRKPGRAINPRRQRRLRRRASLIAYYDIRLKEPQYAVLEAIQDAIPDDSFIVWDITHFGYYARTHYKTDHPKTYIDSGYQFNVGYSYPAALGVKVAKPERPVVCMVGAAVSCTTPLSLPPPSSTGSK